MVKAEIDIAVIGGGASGLALLYALHLQGQLKHHKVLIIEPELKNSNDRTWSFWTDQEDAAWQMFSPAVSKTWTSIEGPFPGKQALKPYQYSQIRSKDFYQFVGEALEQYPNLEYHRGRLKGLKGKDPIQLEFEDGQVVEADWAFDSRPPRMENKGLIWQSFVGYRIQFTAQEELDLENCRLMDFEVEQQEGLQFMYWLPTSKTEGLIEFTRFGLNVLSEEESQGIIQSYLEGLGIKDYEILEKEIDKIPMTLELNANKRFYASEDRYIRIGARSGAIKASTGFAFKYIVDHCWKIAEAFKQNSAIPTAYHPRRFALYDDLLMRLIVRKEDRIKGIFMRLFQKHPIQRIFRFLDEESRFDEEFRIMYSMPWMPFFWSIKEAILELAKKRLKL